jgi:hypothetical protein
MGRLSAVLAVLVLGFGGGLFVGFVTRPEAMTRTVRVTTKETVALSTEARPALAPIPSRIHYNTTDPRSVAPSAAVPEGASILSIDYVLQPPRQLIVTWIRQGRIWQRYGYAIWQRAGGRESGWDRVASRDGPANNETNLHAYYVRLGDVSGDQRPEVVVVSDRNGSAGCAVYYLYVKAGGGGVRQVLAKELCIDEGTVSFAQHALVLKEGVDSYSRGPHCCFRKVRERWLRWEGRRLIEVHREVRKNQRGWPPG